MKILTKEEESEHYYATVKGGSIGGAVGLALGGAGVYAASARFPAFRGLTLPFRAFLISGCGTFSAIIAADTYSPTLSALATQSTSSRMNQKPFHKRSQARRPLASAP